MSDLADELQHAKALAYFDIEESEMIIAVLTKRFAGLDIQYRNPFGRVTVLGQQHGWPARWRVRLRPNKNERAGYRIVAYGDTMDAALQALAGLVSRIEAAGG